MKSIIFQFVFVIFSFSCFTEDFLPKGDYSTIIVEPSKSAMEIFGTSKSVEEKKKVTLEIEKNPGEYNPSALLALSLYYLENNEIEKAAFWMRAAMFRTTVDIKLYEHPSLHNIISIFYGSINAQAKKYINTKEKAETYKNALISATKEIIAWDQNTPRSYDARWVCLHGTGALLNDSIPEFTPEQKEQIIKKERKLFEDANQSYLK